MNVAISFMVRTGKRESECITAFLCRLYPVRRRVCSLFNSPDSSLLCCVNLSSVVAISLWISSGGSGILYSRNFGKIKELTEPPRLDVVASIESAFARKA